MDVKCSTLINGFRLVKSVQNVDKKTVSSSRKSFQDIKMWYDML